MWDTIQFNLVQVNFSLEKESLDEENIYFKDIEDEGYMFETLVTHFQGYICQARKKATKGKWVSIQHDQQWKQAV